jgi:hypothetical protein
VNCSCTPQLIKIDQSALHKCVVRKKLFKTFLALERATLTIQFY